jgi:hypothetical protein
MPAHKPLAEQFWAYVNRRSDDECWPWTGSRNRKGYGTLRNNYRPLYATRVSWSLFHQREWPEGKIACHTCDNPSCVNPQHIWPGTNSENQLDKLRKGRAYNNGSHCPRGHAYAGQPVYPSDKKAGLRRCRSCADEREQRRVA